MSVSTFSCVEKKNPTLQQRPSLRLLNLNQDPLSTVSSLQGFPCNAIQHTESLSPSQTMEQRREVFFRHWAPPITRFAFFIANLISEIFVLLLL